MAKSTDGKPACHGAQEKLDVQGHILPGKDETNDSGQVLQGPEGTISGLPEGRRRRRRSDIEKQRTHVSFK
eukprot:366212-Chlamydomonas_euryale.AAC.10